MIVTVTLNPSLDRTFDVTSLTAGRVNRAGHTRLDPGGKGVNVSRALVAHGIATRAVLPHGGHEGAQLIELLQAEGVTLAAVPIAGRTRSNITLVDSAGTVTKVVPVPDSSVVRSSNRAPGRRDTATMVVAPLAASCRTSCGPMLPVAPMTR